MSKIQGPEEMKWPQKELYTYNVRDGDSFILDEKVSLGKQRNRNLSFASQGSPTRPYNTSKTGEPNVEVVEIPIHINQSNNKIQFQP